MPGCAFSLFALCSSRAQLGAAVRSGQDIDLFGEGASESLVRGFFLSPFCNLTWQSPGQPTPCWKHKKRCLHARMHQALHAAYSCCTRMLGSASLSALWQLFLLFLLVFPQGWGCFLWPAIAPGGGPWALLGLCFHLLDKHRLPLAPFTVQSVKMLPGCLEEGHWGSGQRASSPKVTTADSRGRWTSPSASDGQRHGAARAGACSEAFNLTVLVNVSFTSFS